MAVQKSLSGKDFLRNLQQAGADKEAIFSTLNDALIKNNPINAPLDKRALMANVSDNQLIANIKIRKAEINAELGRFMFAEDYIHLALASYEKNGLGEIKDFKNDFQKHSAQKEPVEKTKTNVAQHNVELNL